VEPLLARVRWNKAADALTTFTHMALRVKWSQRDDPPSAEAAAADSGAVAWSPSYLVDVGFGGIGPLTPIVLEQVTLCDAANADDDYHHHGGGGGADADADADADVVMVVTLVAFRATMCKSTKKVAGTR
jgi:hypothetical protein